MEIPRTAGTRLLPAVYSERLVESGLNTFIVLPEGFPAFDGVSPDIR